MHTPTPPQHLLRHTPAWALLASLAFAALACSTPPKPAAMVDFEAMRQDRYTERIRQNEKAKPYLDASDKFYDLAMEYYEDGEIEKVKDYALLGTMRHRTAEALARAEDARKRLSAANEKYAKFQGVRNDLDSNRELIEETIVALEQKKKLSAEVAAANLTIANEGEKLKLEKLKANVQKALDDAKVKLTEAEGLKAPEFAADKFNKASNMLKSAQKLFETGKYNEALETAQEATGVFTAAIAISKPMFGKEQNVVKLEEQKKALFETAHNRFRELVRVDGRGMVITVDSLFQRNKTELLSAQYHVLDFVVDLAKKYPDFPLMVEGHTSMGGARNITISQRRADETKNYFLQRGLPASRIQTAGAGGEKPFFKNQGRERWRNDRVDIIFLYNK